MAGVMRIWNHWEIQILVLVSFFLQVFLLMFASRRRRNISVVPKTLLWLAYLLADSTAIYILGHMSFSGKSHEHQQLVAFWAPFLLVHLGGQDTITAYSMEDNHLWPRHLLSLMVQALGVAYVLYKYIAGSRTLVRAAALIFVSGVLKYGERVWALRSSNLESTGKFLDEVEKPGWFMKAERPPYLVKEDELGSEEVLQGAHDLFPICVAQFIDYKLWPSEIQCQAMKLFEEKGRMYELIEMQLSLMHDLLYTKAAVIHTWCGCFIRAVSSGATITAFMLFQSSTGSSDFDRVDAIVTYILLAGALLLEMAAVLRAMGSTWTCALLRARRWDRLHGAAMSVRRRVKAAEKYRRWSGSIGQRRLVKVDADQTAGKVSIGLRQHNLSGCANLWKKLYPSFTVISVGTKELVLKEILRMAGACGGNVDIMRSYSGQCALEPWQGLFEDPTSSTDIGFDDKIQAWHFATEIFISTSMDAGRPGPLVDAIQKLSHYLIFLLVERPYMLPSPVRCGLYGNAHKPIPEINNCFGQGNMIDAIRRVEYNKQKLPAFGHGAELARKLLDMEKPGMPEEVLQVVLGVWVEMLCYAAHHCGRHSHARQLNCGGEFITIVWLLTTAMYNRSYCDENWFRVKYFTMEELFEHLFPKFSISMLLRLYFCA